jgi:hypothetical protein
MVKFSRSIMLARERLYLYHLYTNIMMNTNTKSCPHQHTKKLHKPNSVYPYNPYVCVVLVDSMIRLSTHRCFVQQNNNSNSSILVKSYVFSERNPDRLLLHVLEKMKLTLNPVNINMPTNHLNMSYRKSSYS